MSTRISQLITILCLSAISVVAQTKLDGFRRQLAAASDSTEIQRVIRAAEAASLPTSDLISLRLDVFNNLRHPITNERATVKERNALAQLSISNEQWLLENLNKHLAELDRLTPDDPATSHTAVTLAQLLQEQRSFEESQDKRATAVKARNVRISNLYNKALAIETKLAPNSANSLSVKVLLADHYLSTGQFEEAIPMYEQYLKGVEAAEGKGSAPVCEVSLIWRRSPTSHRISNSWRN